MSHFNHHGDSWRPDVRQGPSMTPAGSNISEHDSRVGVDRRPRAPTRRASTGAGMSGINGPTQIDQTVPQALTMTLGHGVTVDDSFLVGLLQELFAADHAYRRQKEKIIALEQEMRARNDELESTKAFPSNPFVVYLRQTIDKVQRQLTSAKNDCNVGQKKRNQALQALSSKLVSLQLAKSQSSLLNQIEDHGKQTRILEEKSKAQHRTIEELKGEVKILRQGPMPIEVAASVGSLKKEIQSTNEMRSAEVEAYQRAIEALQAEVKILRQGPTSTELAASVELLRQEIKSVNQLRSAEGEVHQRTIENLQAEIKILHQGRPSIKLADDIAALKEEISTTRKSRSAEVDAETKFQHEISALNNRVQLLKESLSAHSMVRYLKPSDLDVYVENFEEYKKQTHSRLSAIESDAAASMTKGAKDGVGIQEQLDALSRNVGHANDGHQKLQDQAKEYSTLIRANQDAIQDLRTLSTQLDDTVFKEALKLEIARVKQNVTEQNALLKTVRENVSRNSHSIIQMNSRYNNLSSESLATEMTKKVNPFIATIQGNIASQNTSLGQLKTVTTDIQSKYNDLGPEISGIKASLSDVQTQISVIEQKVTRYEATVQTVQETCQQSHPKKQLDELTTELSELRKSASTIRYDTDRLKRKIRALPKAINTNHDVCMENNLKLIADVKTAKTDIDTRLRVLEVAAPRGRLSDVPHGWTAQGATTDIPPGEVDHSNDDAESDVESQIISRPGRIQVGRAKAQKAQDSEPNRIGIDDDDLPLGRPSSGRSRLTKIASSESSIRDDEGDVHELDDWDDANDTDNVSRPQRQDGRVLKTPRFPPLESDDKDQDGLDTEHTIVVRETRSSRSREQTGKRRFSPVDLTQDNDISEDQLLEMFRGPLPPQKGKQSEQAKTKSPAVKVVGRRDKKKGQELKRKREEPESSPSMVTKKPTGRRK